MIASVTGHRPHKLQGEWDHAGPYSRGVVEAFRYTIRERGITRLITGGALGTDTLAARAAYLEGVPYVVAVPFEGQELKWPTAARTRYAAMLLHADEVVVVSEGGYSREAMQTRNRWMVDHSELLLAWWNGSGGGTRNCIHYALTRDVPVYNLNPNAPHILPGAPNQLT